MLNIRTIALGINNLSDARYFSSYGVNWMSFPSSRQMDNISAIKEIIAWVEGPECAVEIDTEDQDFLGFFLEEVEVSGVVGPEEVIPPITPMKRIVVCDNETTISEKIKQGDLVIVQPQALANIPQDKLGQVFLDIRRIAPEEVTGLVQKYKGVGIALYGSDEEKVGLKSFEEQDELIDVLLDIEI